MTEKIKLVQGDTLPSIKLTLKNTRNQAIDVSDATVNLYLREKGSSTILETIVCSNFTDGTDGQIVANFAGSALNANPGYYEGEVEINFPGGIQTVYEILQFQVRAQFAH